MNTDKKKLSSIELDRSEEAAPLNKSSAQSSDTYTDDQVSSTPTNYERASSLSVIHYIYVIKNLCQIRKKPKAESLHLDDLSMLGKTEEVGHKILEFESEYRKYKTTHGAPSLFWPILKVFRNRILKEQLIVCSYAVSKMLFTLFLANLLGCIEDGKRINIWLWARLLFAMMFMGLYSHHSAFFQGYRLVSQLKPALIGLLYRKISRLSNFAVNQISIGKIVNIAANDLNVLEFLTFFTYDLVIAPFVLIGCIAILWSFVGVACLPGVVFLFLIWPIQIFLAKISGKYMHQKNSVTDERVKLTGEMIEGIRLLKMYGWDTEYADTIRQKRNEEASLLKKMMYTDFFSSHMLGKLSPAVGSMLIYGTYFWFGGTLTASKAYATLMLLGFLRQATVMSCSLGLKFVGEIRLTFKRIIQVLEVSEIEEEERYETPIKKENGVEFDSFSAYWSNNFKPTLEKLTFSVKKGTLCAIVGRIGSGKSTALMSFLNEIPKTEGSLRFAGRLAYVEQEVTIFPGTLRSNILFGRTYDEKRYKQIVEACCLADDFKEFPNSDLTEVGEKGTNLSGGQKTRTSLARALYSDADIYLLDDPLSAVDAKVANDLFNKAIRGILRNKTVLLATHQVHFAREAEKIVVLENGRLKAEGTLDEIMKQDKSIIPMFETKSHKKSEFSLEEETPEKEVEKLEAKEQGKTDVGDKESREEKGKLITAEKDESKEVGWSTYWYYIKNSGSVATAFLLVAFLIAIEVLYVLYTRFLGYWTNGKWTSEYAVQRLSLLIITYFFALILREILFVNFSMSVSTTLHEKILNRVIRAVVEFFDTNPAGRILNRFSNDIGVLDRFILQAQNELMDAMFYFPTLLITICILYPGLAIPTFVLILIILTLVKALKKYIIQGRGVELLTRSPIYSFFSTTLSGLISIRLYGQGKRFIHEFTNLLNRNCRAFSFYYDVTRLFAFYCDLASAIFAVSGIAIMLAVGGADASIVGLICTYLLTITDRVQFTMRQLLLHIMQMASTERIRAYTQIKQEGPLEIPSDKQLVQDHWPSKGEIVFRNVHMKYRQATDHVLKGVSFSIKPGEKIGCVGRTGAGKTSIIQALFRMVEIDQSAAPDASIMIDGVETSKVGLHTLRKHISIIPQFPFVFRGSVKRNLDPLKEYSGKQIISALEETNLWDYIKTLEKGLDTDMSNTSSVFSVGQKQLICLARVMLQNNKILVLDEATANIDFETDNFIQKKIMERFKDATIFTIAHRLSTVANYDKVLVMSGGRVVEFDHPYKLLVIKEGDESITRTDGVFASMVKNTGAKHASVIFEIARKSYFQKIAK